MDIIRQPLIDLSVQEVLTNEDIVDKMVGYFDLQDDHAQIRASIKVRHGTGIRTVTDPNNPKAIIETYVKKGFSEQVDSGMLENISLGFGNKIIDALATLFTEKGMKFDLSHESTDDTDSAEELLNSHRKNGGFLSSVTDADRRSVQCGSSAIFVSFDSGHLTYQVFTPASIRTYFADHVTMDGETRPVDKLDIEDATAIVIRLNRVDVDLWNYIAIFGRSDLYENGRYVTYQASRSAMNIPEPYSEGVIEYDAITPGKPCNPLSWLANQYPEMDIPEYPLVVINGGTTYDGTILPVTTSLYDDCLEFDTAASHILSTATDAASGGKVFTRTEQAASQPLPRSTVGPIDLPIGMTYKYESYDASASETAFEVLKNIMIHRAAGYSVPDYMVVSEESTVDASSGVALAVKTRPLKKARERRTEDMAPRVLRLFNIEKCLIKLFNQEGSESELLFNCTQNWESGELKLPENKKEAADRIIALMDKGILDTIAAIREYYQLTTDAEAEEIYNRMADRKAEYPSLAEQPKKQVGLFKKPTNGK